MTERVSSEMIESIVGTDRHPIQHWGRAVSDEQRVYILHSEACRAEFDDLRDCPFSEALDGGFFYGDWGGREDQPVMLGIDPSGWLVPAEVAIARALSTERGEK